MLNALMNLKLRPKVQIMMILGIALTLSIVGGLTIIPRDLQLYWQSSILAIAIGLVGITIADSKNGRTENKLEEILRLLREVRDTSPKEASTAQPVQPIDTEEMAVIQDEWKTVIETQMHFNEMTMQVRTATVSVVLAIFGAAGYSLQYSSLLLDLTYFKIHASALIILAGIFVLIAMFIIDYKYYYKMLLGAVRRGYELDKEFSNRPGHKYFSLSTHIRDAIGKRNISRYFVLLFYILPIAGGLIFMVFILLGYVITVPE